MFPVLLNFCAHIDMKHALFSWQYYIILPEDSIEAGAVDSITEIM